MSLLACNVVCGAFTRQQAEDWMLAHDFVALEMCCALTGDRVLQKRLLASFQLWSTARLVSALYPMHACDCSASLLLRLSQVSERQLCWDWFHRRSCLCHASSSPTLCWRVTALRPIQYQAPQPVQLRRLC